MYSITHGSTHGLDDVSAFLDTLKREGARLFAPGQPLYVSRAPGRLDVMGGIADYSGSLVLELPLREAALAAVQIDAERCLRITSLGAEGHGEQAGAWNRRRKKKTAEKKRSSTGSKKGDRTVPAVGWARWRESLSTGI